MRVIDSHTEGEPTRVVISGGPDLGGGSLGERLERLRAGHDDLRRALILEPRGSEVMVGALLCPPSRPDCDTAVIFFNNRGYLGMCGHGAIGVAVTLAWLGRDAGGSLKLETPVGAVDVALENANTATVENVPSYLHAADVEVQVDGYPPVRGDVAWGGNWFFLVDWPHTPITREHISELMNVCRQIKATLRAQGVCGERGAEIDHIELFSAAAGEGADSRNFVLCPGDAWDRSPCGTGTSAKLAALAARGGLAPGERWVQESITGGRFEARYRHDGGERIVVSITGRAWITAEAVIVRQDNDPLRDGLVPV
jgi:4-hydroxyproline epimerase